MKIEKKSKKLLEADLTPMIDMTFQLIAFFMVLTNFTQVEQNQLINLPSSELAKPPEEDERRYDITLNLTGPPRPASELEPGQAPDPPEGWVILSGKARPIDTLGNALETEVNIALSQKYEFEQINVVIRADQNSRAEHLYKLIDVCKANKLERFALRVMEEAN